MLNTIADFVIDPGWFKKKIPAFYIRAVAQQLT